MQREDTAVQRYANDLQAAGFNKLMAAGAQGSGSQAMTTFGGNAGGEATKIDINPVGEYLSAKQQAETIQLTKAERELQAQKLLTEKQETNLKKVEATYKQALTNLTNEQANKVIAEINNIKADTANKAKELEIANFWDLPPGVDPRINNWFQLCSMLGNKALTYLESGNWNKFEKETQNIANDNGYNLDDWKNAFGKINWEEARKNDETSKALLQFIKILIVGPGKK